MTSHANELPSLNWFDAHQDLAYIAQAGRDMTQDPISAGGNDLPGCITFPSLNQGRVRWALGTLFTEPHAPSDPWGYGDSDDVQGARAAAVAQLQQYQTWEKEGRIKLVKTARELTPNPGQGEPLQIILLMENADPVADQDDAKWWFDQGVRVVGLSWTHGSRYAGGNGRPSVVDGKPAGLTQSGRTMVKTLDQLGIIHDLTHLNDAAARELLLLASGPVVATHSASRTLQSTAPITVQGVDSETVAQRHISDELLAGLAGRECRVGLPLYSRFLSATPDTRPSLERVVEHLDYLADKLGGRQFIGLGSDFDGGFSADDTPIGLEGPQKLFALAEALKRAGWPFEQIQQFASGNWLRFFEKTLPAG